MLTADEEKEIERACQNLNCLLPKSLYRWHWEIIWLKQGGHIGLNKVHLDTIGGPVSSNGTGGALAFSQLAGARKAKTPASKKACKEAPKKRQNFEESVTLGGDCSLVLNSFV